MKYLFVLMILICIICFFCGCTGINSLKNVNTVTACGIEMVEGQKNYIFCIASSKAVEEENGSEQSILTYKFSAPDFYEATAMLKNMLGPIDFGHLAMFMADANSVNKEIWKDIDEISMQIKINPMMKFFICSGSIEETLQIMSSKYGQDISSFIEKVYYKDGKKILCTFSEIMFSLENNLFTASVPVISVNENELISEQAIALCSVDRGVTFLSDNDYQLFRDYLKKNGKSSKNLDIKIVDDKIKIKLKNTGTNTGIGLITELANKYKNLNQDILNGVYFSKKKFKTYSQYKDFVNDFSMHKLIYEQG